MSELATAVCSITPTQRRRFFWAAWWTGAPRYKPFRKPDASDGGAASEAEALAEAERISGRHLSLIEPYWAHAVNRMLRGEAPPPPPQARRPRPVERQRAQPSSPWSVLGLAPGASLLEIKRAFRQRALETHPDQGGDAAQFRELQRAYEKLVDKATRKRAR